MNKVRLLLLMGLSCTKFLAGQIIVSQPGQNTYDLAGASILVDSTEEALVLKAADLLAADLQSVTSRSSKVIHHWPASAKTIIVLGTLSHSSFIRELEKHPKTTSGPEKDSWEAYRIYTRDKPGHGFSQALVIQGTDRRGTAYGALELSKQAGVSPWSWWADVPVKKQEKLYASATAELTDAPKVRYRGIFINDEAPALSSWSREKFGGFNAKFYARVFELLLRLKGNYIWPAMWGNAFYDDDSLNIQMADTYGIVVGSSHHEPMMRAHDEWRRYGQQKKWNYDSSRTELQAFWKTGMKRAWNEKIVTVGMRGDGDEPMSRETATDLLEKIVQDQRNIIKQVTGKPASQTPQLWALYKEVQDYYQKGMRVPDDVTLLLCDDNWGNLRMLPPPGSPARKGGYGLYYHFDYVGGPRNYKWINTNPLPRIWEQLHLAWEHDVKQVWIVNVGDIKPMEFPISFFLDMAWNPDKTGPDEISTYTKQWATQQFGPAYAGEIAELLRLYSKWNGRRKPELLDHRTFSFQYDEWNRVVSDYKNLEVRAVELGKKLPQDYQSAYYQLVLHPIQASANLYQLYYEVAQNHLAYKENRAAANLHADKAAEFFLRDSLITQAYHRLNNGKWNHLMNQTHIGYESWQQPDYNKMPPLFHLSATTVQSKQEDPVIKISKAPYPGNLSHPAYVELNGVVSIEAGKFSRKQDGEQIKWTLLPDHGRTGDAITSFPSTAPPSLPSSLSPYLEYEIYTYSQDSCSLNLYFSPTLNYYGTSNGLEYAISIDNETPQVISINREDKTNINGIWNRWVAENRIRKTSRHFLAKPGRHLVKFWRISGGVVLQNLVLDTGGEKPSYLGPPSTLIPQKSANELSK